MKIETKCNVSQRVRVRDWNEARMVEGITIYVGPSGEPQVFYLLSSDTDVSRVHESDIESVLPE